MHVRWTNPGVIFVPSLWTALPRRNPRQRHNDSLALERDPGRATRRPLQLDHIRSRGVQRREEGVAIIPDDSTSG